MVSNMSTDHRVLDGEMYHGRTKNGRKIKRWKLNSKLEHILYKGPLTLIIQVVFGFINQKETTFGYMNYGKN